MLDLRDDTVVRAKNIFCPKVDRMGTARAVSASVPQELPKSAKIRVVQHPPGIARRSFRGGAGGTTRTTKVAHQNPGESSRMRAGGATDGILDDSARCSERACARVPPRAYALMYSTFAPGGAGTTKIRPERRAPRAQLLGKKRPQGWFLACADGTFQTHQYPRNKKMLRNFCARTS